MANSSLTLLQLSQDLERAQFDAFQALGWTLEGRSQGGIRTSGSRSRLRPPEEGCLGTRLKRCPSPAPAAAAESSSILSVAASRTVEGRPGSSYRVCRARTASSRGPRKKAAASARKRERPGGISGRPAAPRQGAAEEEDCGGQQERSL